MNYSQTLTWLFKRLPMYQRVGAPAMRLGLDQMKNLSAALGNPHRSLKCIHIAGTNGKGSTAHMLASVLQTAGYTVGLYTSPHLHDFRERIKINGQPIDENTVVDFVNENLEPITNTQTDYKIVEINIRHNSNEYTPIKDVFLMTKK